MQISYLWTERGKSPCPHSLMIFLTPLWEVGFTKCGTFSSRHQPCIAKAKLIVVEPFSWSPDAIGLTYNQSEQQNARC